MFCPNCGTKNDDGVVFCANCGTSLLEQNAPVIEPMGSVSPVEPVMVSPVEPVTPVAPVTPVEPVMSAPVEPVTPVMATEPVTPVTPVQPVNSMPNNNFQPQGQPVNNGFQPQGQPVNNGFQPQNNAPTPKGGLPKVVKILIPVVAALLVLIIGAVVFVNIGKNGSDYKKTAEKYVQSLTSGDYEKAFNSLTLPASEFLTADTFRAANADTGIGEITTMTLTDGFSAYQTPNSKVVNVSYVLNIGKVGNLELILDKSTEKYMLFFDTYKVNASSLYKEDVIVLVPKGLTLKVNGVTVDSKYILDEEKASEYTTSSKADVYEIPYVFCGNVKYTVCSDFVKDYDKETVIESDAKEEELRVTFMSSTSDFELKEDGIKGLEDQAVKDLQTIVKAGVEQKEFSTISSMVAADYQSAVKTDYEYYTGSRIHSSLYDYSAINLSNIKADCTTTYYNTYSNGQIRLKVALSFDFTGEYSSSYGGTYEITEADKKSNSSSYFYYTFEDGKWVISDMYVYISRGGGTLKAETESETSSESASEGSSESASETESSSAAN